MSLCCEEFILGVLVRVHIMIRGHLSGLYVYVVVLCNYLFKLDMLTTVHHMYLTRYSVSSSEEYLENLR